MSILRGTMKNLPNWLRGSDQVLNQNGPFDLLAPEFLKDPDSLYRLLREAHPIAPIKQGGFLITRHADVLSALSNKDLSNAPSRFSVLAAQNRQKYTAADIAANIPPFLDRPRHVDIRKALSSSFFEVLDETQKWLPGHAWEWTARHSGTKVDLVTDIATPYAVLAMARFVGLTADQKNLKTISENFFHLFAPVKNADAFKEVNAHLSAGRSWIESHIDKSEPMTLLGVLKGKGLARAEVVDNALLVLADGIENIIAACAMCFDILHQEGIRLSDSQTPDTCIDEALRLSSPAQIIPRVAAHSCVLLDQELTAGTPVFLALGSANLDPDAYDLPHTFRLNREKAQFLPFGAGRHSCIGAPLARALTRELVAAMQNAGALPANSPIKGWHERFGHRWPTGYSLELPEID